MQVTFLVPFCWSVNCMSWVFGSENISRRCLSIAIYRKIDLYYLCLFRFFSGLWLVWFWSANYTSIPDLNLWPVLILEIFSCWDIEKGQLKFLVTFLAVFFQSVNCTILVCKLYLLFQTILNLWPVLILEIFSD